MPLTFKYGFPQALEPVTITDADVFTFALNLEYLEAEFFTWATTASLDAPA